MEHKKTILVDLDGVLNEYVGDYNPDFIPEMKPEAQNFLNQLSQKYKIIIFSTRPKKLVTKWIYQYNLTEVIADITNKKLPCYLYIDDRCIQFNGNYTATLKKIENFTPWYSQTIGN